MDVERTEIENVLNQKIDLYTKQFGKNFKIALIEILSLEKMLNPVQSKETEEKEELIPVSKWNDYYPDPSVGAMKMLVFYRKTNGFDDFGVVEKRGTKNLINANKYREWRKAKNNKEI